ncbi:MAG: glycosyltransferase family 2 protein [Pseudomonadota bacterium]
MRSNETEVRNAEPQALNAFGGVRRVLFQTRFRVNMVFRKIFLAASYLHLNLFVKRIIDDAQTRQSYMGPVVVCVLKNGVTFVDAFIAHHKAIGFGHFIFLDNGSSDGTLEALLKHECVSVFQTSLSYRYFKDGMAYWLLKRFGGKNWTLKADIDEFLDFPQSEHLSVTDVLDHFKASGKFAVPLHMVDMYPAKVSRKDDGEDWLQTNTYFEAKSMRSLTYDFLFRRKHGFVSNQVNGYIGGVRERVFDVTNWLTKGMLLIPEKCGYLRDNHFLVGCRYSDTSFVLKHYRFAARFFENVEKICASGSHFSGSVLYFPIKERLSGVDELHLFMPQVSLTYTSSLSPYEAGIGVIGADFRGTAAVARLQATELTQN